ncbi:MAG: response regulator [Planctomycetota bacterium]
MPTRHAPTVLVVDDEPGIRELLVDSFQGSEFDVTPAASGKEAIEIARELRPDLIVTDLLLGDLTGLDVLDTLRAERLQVPAVVITGYGDPQKLCEASRRRPVEMLTKPLDVTRLVRTVRREVSRADQDRQARRIERLRRLAHGYRAQRQQARKSLRRTCADLTGAYRNLSAQLRSHETLLNYQRELLGAKIDDDVFRTLFRTFVRTSGPVFGASVVCDSTAQLRIVGRFGVPHPDSLEFTKRLTQPVLDAVLASPQTMILDAGAQQEMFDPSLHRYLPGLSIMAVPLIPSPGELIGVVIFYRKGEQPFIDDDVALADAIATPTALAVQRND